MAYMDFLDYHEIRYFRNCFLMPTEGNEIVEIGYVEMEFLQRMGLADIQIRLLPAKQVFQLFLDNEKLDEATFHFTPGTHLLSQAITLPGKDTYGQEISYTITGDGKAVLDGKGINQIFIVSDDNSHVTVKDITLTHGSTATGSLVLITALHDTHRAV